jgi:hypothetical protein
LSGCNYLQYAQRIESPDGQFNYCLYLDGVGIGDSGYYVLKLEKSIDPEKLWINYSIIKGLSIKDSEWIESKQILFNYDEAELFTLNPKIELIKNRYLVFSRGGYSIGLYDVKLEKAIVNIASPWNEWYGREIRFEKYNRKREELEYGQWIQQNLDKRIKDYIIAN